MMNNVKQQGFTLIELMVALSLGLVILLALTSVYVTANNVAKQQSVTAQLDETARQVFRRLSNDFRQAGFVDIMDAPTKDGSAGNGSGGVNSPIGTRYAAGLLSNANQRIDKIYGKSDDFTAPLLVDPNQYSAIGYISNSRMMPVQGCDTAFPTSVAFPAGCSGADASSTSQGIRIAYQAVSVSGKSGLSLRSATQEVLDNTGIASDKGALDCTGSAIPDTANGFVVNQYELNDGNFRCAGNGGNTEPVVQGVEELTFRYLLTAAIPVDKGVSSSESGRYVADIRPAGEITKANVPLLWSAVVGVEVCLIVAADPPDGTQMASLRQAQNNQRPTCARKNDDTFEDNVAMAAGDNRLYRRAVRVFSIPNSLNVTR
ncbi:prepilin-type N-terminal cleavage/methylation domain-containing protein [Suttonella sp. R2A3]|uniref:prepilin-type N-terminal cleavage/methylation domain-containing protein n=1 Tax=Suttonella sp. R2A3 TaxID=2908648 RepID=UPI001F1B2630|nr:prepilin-type N-terminal cleavage/methylation domain-containing protein [Suttonella sp. R2A3]UJF25239.1 prepilin-type N-terminal cleavage/methylation domain-containing protein [Suttonella sp. R2A3]